MESYSFLLNRQRKNAAELAKENTKVDANSANTKCARKSRRKLTWFTIRALFQQIISCVSLLFIISSGFFALDSYNGVVWERSTLMHCCLAQSIFEFADTIAELYFTLVLKEDSGHMPWDSIVHHIATGTYYMHMYLSSKNLSHDALGLAVVGLSCQFIGILYTAHRLGFRSRLVGSLLLIVQGLWRFPLGLVSVMRAVIHRNEVPFIHFVMCVLLLSLDVRWTMWSYRNAKKIFKKKRV